MKTFSSQSPLFLAVALLVMPFGQTFALSAVEADHVLRNGAESYLYCGKDHSKMHDVVTEISKFDGDTNSPVWQLRNHIERGFSIGEESAIIQALVYAEEVINSRIDNDDRFVQIQEDLNAVIDAVVDGKLDVSDDAMRCFEADNCCPGNGSKVIKVREKLYVLDSAKFFKNVEFKDVVRFRDDVRVDGSLSVADQVIGCDLTVGCNINMNDSLDITIGNINKNGIPFVHNFGTVSTYVGANAGNFTTTGVANSGFGVDALALITTAVGNSAFGTGALAANTAGSNNTAVGVVALTANTTGIENTAMGQAALASNTVGVSNTAVGVLALGENTTGTQNTAVGINALNQLTIGNSNIALGASAGAGYLSNESNNICIGNVGTTTDSNTIRIGGTQTRAFVGGVRGATTGVADAIAVLIDSAGQLGTISSTRRVKHNIQDMNNDSAGIYNLRPVTFAYNSDATERTQYGLIAEEADAAFPAIVVYDADGQPQTVQYHVLPALMLNELQKLAARVAVLEARA